MKDKNQTSRIHIDIPKEQYQALKAKATMRGKSLAQLFLDALELAEELEKSHNNIPEDEKWLYCKDSSESLESLKRGLNQEGKSCWEDLKNRLKLIN